VESAGRAISSYLCSAPKAERCRYLHAVTLEKHERWIAPRAAPTKWESATGRPDKKALRDLSGTYVIAEVTKKGFRACSEIVRTHHRRAERVAEIITNFSEIL
jgi:hypothetical protein